MGLAVYEIQLLPLCRKLPTPWRHAAPHAPLSHTQCCLHLSLLMLKQEVSSLVTPAASEMFSGHEGLVATVTDRTDTEHFLYHRKLSWTAPLQRQENKIQAENH